jgi:hypothetical protein
MTATRNRRLPLLGRLAPVVGLLVVSPIAAEYLSGYQVFNLRQPLRAWPATSRSRPRI